MSDDRLSTALDLCIQKTKVCPMQVNLLGNANYSTEYLFDWRQSVRPVCFACQTVFGLTFFPVEKGNDYVLKNIPIFFFIRKRSKKSAAGVPRRVGLLLAEKFISADDYRRPEYEMRIEYPGIPEYLWFAQNFSFRCAASPPASADGHMPPFGKVSQKKLTGGRKC